jgi:plasmid segregation protein ParM
VNFVGIDTGRKYTKVANGTVITFPSVVGTGRKLNLENRQDYDVAIDGEHFFIGHLAEESIDRREMASESKLHLETRALFLTALALATKGEPTIITTGAPVSQHTPENKVLFGALINGKHQVRINGQEKALSIDSIQVVPEGAGAWWNAALDEQGRICDQTLIKQPVTRILDMGSRTVNYLTLLAGRYLDRASGTLNYGCMELELGGNPDMLARRILADLTRRWPGMRRTDMLFLAGGGALIMRDAFTQEFPKYLTADDPVTANARGYRKLGMVYATKNKSSVF